MRKPATLKLEDARRKLDKIYASRDRQTIAALSLTLRLYQRRLRLEAEQARKESR
jgi:hypothetical protein